MSSQDVTAIKYSVVKDSILFKFVEDTGKGFFKNKTSWGFEVVKKQDDTKYARWGEVLAVGKKVKNVQVGQYILIEPLMWTLGVEHNGQKFWATNEEKVMLVSKEIPEIHL
jgi:hypothetical protein